MNCVFLLKKNIFFLQFTMQSFVLILLITNLILVSDQTCLEPFELLDFNQTHYGIKTDLKKVDNSFYLTNRCAVDTPRSNRKGNNWSKFTFK